MTLPINIVLVECERRKKNCVIITRLAANAYYTHLSGMSEMAICTLVSLLFFGSENHIKCVMELICSCVCLCVSIYKMRYVKQLDTFAIFMYQPVSH